MAVLTILMTGAARRQAVDPAPPATMTKRPCRARIRLPAEPGIGFLTLGDRHWSGTGERSAAAMGGISRSAPDEVDRPDPGILRVVRVRGYEVDDLRDGAAAD